MQIIISPSCIQCLMSEPIYWDYDTDRDLQHPGPPKLYVISGDENIILGIIYGWYISNEYYNTYIARFATINNGFVYGRVVDSTSWLLPSNINYIFFEGGNYNFKFEEISL